MIICKDGLPDEIWGGFGLYESLLSKDGLEGLLTVDSFKVFLLRFMRFEKSPNRMSWSLASMLPRLKTSFCC